MNDLLSGVKSRKMSHAEREMNHDFLRPELQDLNREIVELHKFFDERCPCTSHKIHPDRISMETLSPDLMERNIRAIKRARSDQCVGEYVHDIFGNFNISSFEDCHARIFALDSESRSCIWSFSNAKFISEWALRKYGFTGRNDKVEEDEDSDQDEEKEMVSRSEEAEQFLKSARENNRHGEVFRDIICEFHGSYWIYECFYNPTGGKIRVPWSSNKRIWAGPFTDWCQSRNMFRIPSLTYFNAVTRDDCTWLLKSKNQRFSQCDICWNVHANLHDQSTWDVKRLFGHVQCCHIEVVRNSRRWSNMMQLLAKWFPALFHFEMADRWNAMTTCIPWVWRCVSKTKCLRLGCPVQIIEKSRADEDT